MTSRGKSDDDPFRWCVYCDADCRVDEPDHADDCPFSTGVFPITERDVCDNPCPHCSCGGGMTCMDCGEPFKLGDFYTHRVVTDGDRIGRIIPSELIEDAPVGEVICLGCAALADAKAS